MSTRQIADIAVDVEAAADCVFDYLTDPARRPEWQSSLRRVDDVVTLGDRPGGVGSSWTDITIVPGIAPRLEVIACVSHGHWAEIGHWRGVDARLTLDFDETGDGTRVRARATLTVPWVAAPALPALTLFTPQALTADLRRAAGRIGAL